MKKILIILMAVSSQLFAQTAYTPVNKNRILVPALPFLNFDYGARSAAMGGAGVALSPDGNAGFLNPAQYVFLKDTSGVSVNYTPYARNLINDMNLYGLNAYRVNGANAFGLTVKYFDAGKIEMRDDNGTYEGMFSSYEFAISGNYSKRLSEKNSMGIALTYGYSNLAGRIIMVSGLGAKPANFLNGSIYFYHNGLAGYNKEDRANQWLNYGFSLSNIGGKVNYGDYKNRSFQPTLLKAGVAQNFAFGEDENTILTLTADASKLLIPTPAVVDVNGNVIKGVNAENISGFGTIVQSWGSAPDGFSETLKEITYCFGAEIKFKKTLSLRGGYYSQNKQKGDIHYFTAGVGLNQKKFGLDFSYLIPSSSGNLLANTWRLSLLIRTQK